MGFVCFLKEHKYKHIVSLVTVYTLQIFFKHNTLN